MMHRGLHILLAKGPDLTSLGRRFRGEYARLDWSDAVIGLAIVAGVVLLIWLLKRTSSGSSGRRFYNSSGKLFRELCQAHGLNAASRRLLKRLARSQGLKHAARLFVEPQRFEPAALSPSMRMYADQLAELRGRLFE